MNGLGELALAALAFVGGHFLLSSPPVRGPLVAQLGERRFSGVYSLLVAAALVWLLFAYGAAPYIELWPTMPWARLLPMLVMPLAVLFLVGGLTQRNPTMVMEEVSPAGTDPAPGILRITRHPVMWGFGLWALAHIPANGDAAALILFGSMVVLALVGTLIIDAKRRARDPQGFARLAAVTSNIPFAAMIEGRTRMAGLEQWRLITAAAVYFGLLVAHPWIAGVSAM